MSGAVTGEKERRAWDQIALTGATPESYLTGKFMGVLYFPLKQLLLASPVLVLFALFGGVSLMEVLIIVPLLVVCFLTAGSLGLLASATQPTSHQAQGTALLAGAGVLLAPLLPQGWLIAGLLAYFFLGRASMDIVERLLAAGSVAVWVALFGATASPISDSCGLVGALASVRCESCQRVFRLQQCCWWALRAWLCWVTELTSWRLGVWSKVVRSESSPIGLSSSN